VAALAETVVVYESGKVIETVPATRGGTAVQAVNGLLPLPAGLLH
jgi:hypothetical protein